MYIIDASSPFCKSLSQVTSISHFILFLDLKVPRVSLLKLKSSYHSVYACSPFCTSFLPIEIELYLKLHLFLDLKILRKSPTFYQHHLSYFWHLFDQKCLQYKLISTCNTFTTVTVNLTLNLNPSTGHASWNWQS